MAKEKKDTLDLACKYIVQLDMSLHSNDSKIQPNYCTQKDCKAKSAADCLVCCKNYFQEQATIPDGWDVVKEIYEFVKNTSNGIKEQEEKGIEYNASGSLQVAQIFIENKLKAAGIEVE